MTVQQKTLQTPPVPNLHTAEVASSNPAALTVLFAKLDVLDAELEGSRLAKDLQEMLSEEENRVDVLPADDLGLTLVLTYTRRNKTALSP